MTLVKKTVEDFLSEIRAINSEKDTVERCIERLASIGNIDQVELNPPVTKAAIDDIGLTDRDIFAVPVEVTEIIKGELYAYYKTRRNELIAAAEKLINTQEA